MGEGFAAGPTTMGLQHRMLDPIALQLQNIGVVVVEMQNQPVTLVAPGGSCLGLGMLGCDPSLLEQMADAQHGLAIEIGGLDAATESNPGFLAAWHDNLQTSAIQFTDLGAQRPQQCLHFGHPHPVLQGVGVKGRQGTQMVALHGKG
jgi:hypothetical protein